jgi:hypothetical protein
VSIFDGSDEYIHGFLDLEQNEYLKQKSTCRRLADTGKTASDVETLISKLYGQIAANRTSRAPSKENWRSTCQTRLDADNSSPEVLLERAIAILGEKGIMEGWFNQVPVASGLVDKHADKRAAIDLVHLAGNHATLIELKWKSDTPAFAAFEILQYGLAYLFSYIHRQDFGYEDKELMKVNQVSLRVLAPYCYYDDCNLSWLGQGLDEGIRSLAETITSGAIAMDFGFLAFPSGFSLPFKTGREVVTQEGLQLNEEQIQLLVAAVADCKSVW